MPYSAVWSEMLNQALRTGGQKVNSIHTFSGLLATQLPKHYQQLTLIKTFRKVGAVLHLKDQISLCCDWLHNQHTCLSRL